MGLDAGGATIMNVMSAKPHPVDSTDAMAALATRLTASGAVAPQALERAGRVADISKERMDRVLLKLGLVEEAALADAWSSILEVPLLEASEVPSDAILADVLPSRFLRNSGALPVAVGNGYLRVAIVDPLDDYLVAALEARTGLRVSLVLATASDLQAAFDRLYPDTRPSDLVDPRVAGSELVAGDVTRLQDLATDAPAIRMVESIIERAVEAKASDIHLTFNRNGTRLRFRVDGVLNDADAPPPELHNSIVSRLKILADLDIAERRLPQDGRIRLGVSGREIDLRVATMPHLDGEGIVLRILDRTAVKLELPSLGFVAEIEQALLTLLNEPHGIFLVTGPTGSGKTTTLYAALRQLVRPERNVVSVEDPVEYHLDGVAQIQVQRKIGLDFPTILRSVLRQDPDVIMIGEIRDTETAAIANQAALTGHFVLATLHTNSAAASLPRLIDMGLEPYLLSTTVRGILSQRLVRKLCPSCARRVRTEDRAVMASLQRIGAVSDVQAAQASLRDAVGCARCNKTGFSGRIAIAELLIVVDEIRQAILDRADAMRIDQIARSHGVIPLVQAGARRVLAGETTFGELVRVTGEGFEL
jgi:general secretion pathway protein E